MKFRPRSRQQPQAPDTSSLQKWLCANTGHLVQTVHGWTRGAGGQRTPPACIGPALPPTWRVRDMLHSLTNSKKYLGLPSAAGAFAE